MRIILKIERVGVLVAILLSGGLIHAQDGLARKPIPEVPKSDTAKPEPRAGQPKPPPEERPAEEVIEAATFDDHE